MKARVRYFEFDGCKWLTLFNPETGFYVRKEMEGSEEPFWAPMPELLDISITDKCTKGCPYCYQDAKATGRHLPVDDFKMVLEQTKGHVNQCIDSRELVLIRRNGNSRVVPIIDTKQYDEIWDGQCFRKILARRVSTPQSPRMLRVTTTGNRTVLVTPNHPFVTETTTGSEVVQANRLQIGNAIKNTEILEQQGPSVLNIATAYLASGDRKYKLYMRGVRDQVSERMTASQRYNDTVPIEEIADLLPSLDLANARLGMDRSSYELPALLPLNEHFFRLLGAYVAEGSTRAYSYNGELDQATIDEVCRDFSAVFGTRLTHFDLTEHKGITIETFCTWFHHLLFDCICQARIDGKKNIGDIVFDSSVEERMAFLRGYFGDGHIYESASGRGHKYSLAFTTTSAMLDRKMSLLLSTLGIRFCREKYGKEGVKKWTKNSDRTINQSGPALRHVIYNTPDLQRLASVFELDGNAVSMLNSMSESLVNPHNWAHKKSRNLKITKIEEVDTEEGQQVVDLEVEGSHLFVCGNGIIVHNCALGGGEPTEHPELIEIFRTAWEDYGVVPNYTTNGSPNTLTDDIIAATKKYCGAVAVSWHEGQDKFDAIKRFVAAGVTTNIHFIVHNESVEEAINLVNNCPDGVAAIIFLLYKPVGRASADLVLQWSDKVQEFLDIIQQDATCDIGFDACFASALAAHTDLPQEYYDTCDGGRFSCYVDTDLNVSPCSFDKKHFGTLREQSFKEIWTGERFEEYRSQYRNACPTCPKRCSCLGGCSLHPEIVLCDAECKE